MKEFNASRGVQLDIDFSSHARGCTQCSRFNAEKPASAALMCLEGAVLYKRDNTERQRREYAERPDTYASKAEVKRLMQYKE